MRVACAILLVFLIAGVLTGSASAEVCASGFNKAMCHMFCMLNRLAVGTCRILKGQDKCHCYEKRSLPDDGEIARSFLDNGEIARSFFDDGEIARSFLDNGEIARSFLDDGEIARSFLDDGEIARTRKPQGCTGTGKCVPDKPEGKN